ncbi:22633_t:CDS:2 [Racocetra persica]|uniref:22633_t:CDS:1 n=1 Tax=Racocetra persica TaxID=160502 RepID=A0ACA9MFQ6_9GLOM|nr:22633_t:CDS:2 [Racocetra persica]
MILSLNLVNSNLKNIDLGNMDLGNTDLGNMSLENTDLENMDHENINLENMDFEKISLEEMNLRNKNMNLEVCIALYALATATEMIPSSSSTLSVAIGSLITCRYICIAWAVSRA